MIFYPAIDLKNGQCVRLLRGDMEKATVFSDDPAAQAKSFEEQGAEWLHLVDLNGSFEGKPVNMEAVEAILETITIPVQLGGGIRGMNLIDTWLSAGVNRVILGTLALHHPEIVKEACKKYPKKIAVSIDARGGKVATEGWTTTSETDVIELAKRFEDAGVATIIYTNIDRDGAMEGPDVENTKALAEAVDIPIIASGGVSSIKDLKAIKKLEPCGVGGVISGRAIYEGKFGIKEAVATLR